jgi:hypothetical protein
MGREGRGNEQSREAQYESYGYFALPAHICIPKNKNWKCNKHQICKRSNSSLLVCNEAVQCSWRTLLQQLLYHVIVNIWPTSEKAVEERSGRGEDIQPDIDVDEASLPGLNDNACEEDAERDLESHHGQCVCCFADHNPLIMLVTSILIGKRVVTFVSS